MALFNGERVFPDVAQFFPSGHQPLGVTEGGMWYDNVGKQYLAIINGVPTPIGSGSGALLTSNNIFTGTNVFNNTVEITSNLSIKGPIPWRDITGYMPVGGCSSTTPVNGADTTGTISSGSSTLTLAAARDFKNGCGIAVLGAGPTSTLSAPSFTATVSTAARASSQTVTITTSANHGLQPFAVNGMGEGVVVSGCSVGVYNGTFPIQNVADTTHFTYNVSTSGTDSATGCSIQFIFGVVHGVAGSTTYNYKVVKCDFNEGCSPASSTLTITGANATLSKNNYNWVAYPFDTNAALYLLYSDQGLGGALTCVNASVTMAMIDIGGYNPCPSYAPTNPPASATAQTLFTTISSGGGTTSLTLANLAGNNASSKNVYHDESSFLNACITDVNNDQPGTGVGGAEYGCYVPAGVYGMNGPLLTSSLSPNGNVNIYVAGLLNFQTQPWQVLKPGYHIVGIGGGGFGGTVGQHKPATKIQFGNTLPYGVVFGAPGGGGTLKGFQMQYINGTGVYVGATNPSNGTSGVSLEDLAIVEQGSTGNAPCVTIDNDNIGVWLTNISCQAPQQIGGMPCVYITHTPYSSLVNQVLRLVDVNCTFHALKIDGPGGNGSQAAIHDISYISSFSENLPNADFGEIQVDGQVAPSTNGWALQGMSLDHVLMSDAALSGTFVQMSPTGTNNMQISAVEIKNSYLSGVPATCAVITNCQQFPISSTTSSGIGFTLMSPDQNGIVTGVASGVLIGTTLGIVPSQANFGNTPATDVPFVIYATPPNANNVQSTGAGSLAAGTYCGQFTGLDANGFETAPTNVRCQAVGASADIVYDFGGNGNNQYFYSGYNFYYCFTASGTCSPGQKFSSIATISDGGNGRLYTFSTTTGSSSASPPLQGKAMLSWIGQDPATPFSCFFCVSNFSDTWPIGIGMMPTASAGYNLYTKLGVNVGGKLAVGLPVASLGTVPTVTGTGACATITTQVGGSWAGSFKCTGTTGASTVTITFATTQANGYSCVVQDETTRANLLQQTSHTATTCVLTATSVTQNDVMAFSAIGF